MVSEEVLQKLLSEAQVYDYKMPINKVLSKIRQEGVVVVTKQGKYHGVVDERSVINANIARLPRAAVGKFAVKVPLITHNDELDEIFSHFYQTNPRALPFGDKSSIKGLIRYDSLLKYLLEQHMLAKVKAEEIMATPVIGIDANANMAEAVAVMQKNRIDQLLVVSKGKPYGILTSGDVAFMLAQPPERLPTMKSEAHSLDGIFVYSLATPYFYTVPNTATAEAAAREMLNNAVTSVAVTKGGKVIGLITTRELFKALAQKEEQVEVNISGLEENAEYRQDVIEAMQRLAEKIKKFSHLTASSIYVNVQAEKSNYELSASIRLAKGKELRAKASDVLLDKAINELVDRLLDAAKKSKELMITKKEQSERFYG